MYRAKTYPYDLLKDGFVTRERFASNPNFPSDIFVIIVRLVMHTNDKLKRSR